MVQYGNILASSPATAESAANGANGSQSNGEIVEREVDADFVRQAVGQAEVNALRMALHQVTADPELARMPVTKTTIRGGVLFDYRLSPEDQAIVRSKAIQYLLTKGPKRIPPPPSKDESHRLMNLFCGEQIKENDIQPGYEELAFDEFPRGVSWSSHPPPAQRLSNFRVLIVGAGLSGIATAIQLQRLGIQYSVLERQSGVGGSWLWNDYPDCRVDTLSYLFQFKFEKRHHWTDFFASRPETQKYLEDITVKHGILNNFLFDREVIRAKWDEASATWNVSAVHQRTQQEESYTANAIISASGLFSTPNSKPDIPGIDDFTGPIFHTTGWDHSVPYGGKRAGIIGTGSTGTQLTPALVKECTHVDVYQRTPNWIAAYEGYHESVPSHVHWICDSMPFYWNWFCYAAYFRSLDLAALQVRDDEFEARGGRVNERNEGVCKTLTEFIKTKMASKPELVPKLTPKYPPLVRRLVVDNGFYDCLLQDHVDLVTDSIDRITSRGIRTVDGVEREYDLIVLGCGFKTSKYFFPLEYIGRKGARLEDVWALDGARSYLGMAIPGFPNFFSLYGPNHQPRGGSLYSWSEIWARYAVTSIVRLLERGDRAMDVKPDVDQAYQKRLDEANSKLIWESEGAGYYVNEHGRQAVNMPWTTSEYHAMVLEPNLDDYIFT
jgi:4-hydroxyacetophenone monooxygenase